MPIGSLQGFLCGCRHSLNDGVTRATDVMMVGKHASVCGYGEDCTPSLRGSGARLLLAEGDPFCALQACLKVCKSRPPCLRPTSSLPQHVISTSPRLSTRRRRTTVHLLETTDTDGCLCALQACMDVSQWQPLRPLCLKPTSSLLLRVISASIFFFEKIVSSPPSVTV